MESLLLILVFVLVFVWIPIGGLGCWVAEQKGRPQSEGFVLGLLLGPFGVLLEALLPAIEYQPEPDDWAEELEAYREQEEARAKERLELAAARQRDIERDRKHVEEKQAAAARERQRQAAMDREARSRQRRQAWEAVPDWLKMTVLGLGIGLVVCVPFVFLWPTP